MPKTLLFLGKFDHDMLSLEQKVIDISEKANPKLNSIKINSPDIIKYQISQYRCDVWVTLGNVKPTFLLKNIISKSNIILFVFNSTKPETLTFLEEGWEPIISRISPKCVHNQERILACTNYRSNLNQKDSIQKVLNKLKCTQFFTDSISNLIKRSVAISPFSDLIRHLKIQLMNDKAEEEEEEFAIFNNINYKLHHENFTAEIIESPKAKDGIFIKKFINFENNEYIITKVGDKAFQNSCIKSLSFDHESKVTSIGNYAFKNSKIQNIYFPASLEKVCDYWCGGADELVQINVDPNNSFFSTEDKILVYQKEQNKEILFVSRPFKNTYKIPPEITGIGCYAFFKCKEIQNLWYSNKVVKIGDFAFFGSNLESIDLECDDLDIGKGSFYGCSSLSKLNFTVRNSARIGSLAFKGCDSIIDLELSASSKLNLDEFCFSGLKDLKRVKLISNESIKIGRGCFKNCSSLSYFTYQDLNETVKNRTKIVCENFAIDEECFENCSSLESFILSKIRNVKIGSKAFKGCNKLEKITILGELIELGDNLINDCSLLSFIDIDSNSDLTILSDTFQSCSSLTKILLVSKYKITLFNNSFSELSNLSSIEINGQDVIVENECIKNCPSLSSFVIKNASMISIGSNQFVGCQKLENLYLSSSSKISLAKNCLSEFCYIKKIGIDSDEVFIDNECFCGCSSLISIEIKKPKLITISENAFQKCNSLASLTLVSSDLIVLKGCFFDYSDFIRVKIIGKKVEMSSNCLKYLKKLLKLKTKLEFKGKVTVKDDF
ncbi:hypothetical protein M9Y10_019388 [Tritrichomonas musculus]|uniref:Uncharacterized protein n=1 Tax=Tritrichomonas musculus TaxID=1915356 RepID=A0ABR2HK51_9EUKA